VLDEKGFRGLPTLQKYLIPETVELYSIMRIIALKEK